MFLNGHIRLIIGTFGIVTNYIVSLIFYLLFEKVPRRKASFQSKNTLNSPIFVFVNMILLHLQLILNENETFDDDAPLLDGGSQLPST